MKIKRLLNRREAAAYLTQEGFPCASRTLADLAVSGDGPLFVRFHFKPLYRPDDLIDWAVERSKLCRSTSDPGVPLTRSDLGSPESSEAQGEAQAPTSDKRRMPRDLGPGDEDPEGAVQ